MTIDSKHKLIAVTLMLALFFTIEANTPLITKNLSVNFLRNTERVYLNGYPTTIELEDKNSYLGDFQTVEIHTKHPHFSWIIDSSNANTVQKAYQIIISDSKEKIIKNIGNIWDSQKVSGNQSCNIIYNGESLKPDKVYYWKVKTWDNHGNDSGFSNFSTFITANKLHEYYTDSYPSVKFNEVPEHTSQNKNSVFFDFGRAAFGRINLTVFTSHNNDTLTIHLGEKQINNTVDKNPGGSIRHSAYKLKLQKGLHTYVVAIKRDNRNTGPQAILLPQYIGEATPFRYCEVEGLNDKIDIKEVRRETITYPFDDSDSYFHSSDTVLNQIWDLSKYSIKATSFTGLYVDGDRERIPYEADVLLNQLSHYSTAREFNMARRTHEYLIHNPTWPTEWILQSVLIAWEDYRYTGNKQSLSHFYKDLKAKTLIALADDDGFISTRTGKVTKEVLKSIHFNGELRDIVDWPHTGILGLEKDEGGETDGFVFQDINTVVNAFHYRSLLLMSKIAEVLENSDDSFFFTKQAEKLKKNFNQKLFDKRRGVYVDGIGTDHASLHANMFAMAFGLVPSKQIDGVLEFIRSRKMACSVYGAQFLLDALYAHNDAEYGLQLLNSTAERSWYNMIRSGSTITTEAWDMKYKPNQDWNHAWGAAPANLIPRKLMGIEPIEPGFSRFIVKPQPDTLKFAEIKHPTIKGDIFVKFNNNPDKSFNMEVEIPANTTADLYLPYFSSKQILKLNDQKISYRKKGKFAVIENMGSGKWRVEVESDKK